MSDNLLDPFRLRGPGRADARATGAVLVASAGLVALSLVLPHPEGGRTAALIGTALAMALVGSFCWAASPRISRLAVHAVLGATVATTGALIWESSVAAGQFGTIFVWVTLVSAYFFPRRVAAAHLAWLLLVYAGTLAVVDSTAGYSPVTRWLLMAIALVVVMLFTSSIVARRQRADTRARRFFDLSRDMLCTMDRDGRCREANEAWKRTLGYDPEELRGVHLLSFTHADDHAVALDAARRLFAGERSEELETRVQGADGEWHWLRTSYALDPDEGFVYARSTDVTAIKRVEAERAELMEEIEKVARSDALTGLPNRRALDEHLPREMARARRSGSDLCLAIVDIDEFKAYNDSRGHLAGDEVLRQCAIAWDGQIRGADTIVRFGGEEFLVVLPDCTPADAAEIIERLRAATPAGQTCSAGLAVWRPVESVDDLLGRADRALYRAKQRGRDRLEIAAS